MSFYDAAKDAVKMAQKADNIELYKQLLEVQAQALDAQEKLFESHKKIDSLTKALEWANAKKSYVYDEGHTWMIDPKNPRIKFCPVCLNRDGFESPLETFYEGKAFCGHCRGYSN